MKFTEDKVYQVEHQMLGDSCIWESLSNPEDAKNTLAYIAGVYDTVTNIIGAMREVAKL